MVAILPFTDAKAHLSEILDKVFRERDRVIITKNGRPAGVIISPEELEALEEMIEILQDEELLESIRRSRQEAASGKRLRLTDHG